MVRRGRPDLHERFRRVVAVALAKADRDHAEHLARLRPRRRMSPAEQRRAQGRVLFRHRGIPVP